VSGLSLCYGEYKEAIDAYKIGIQEYCLDLEEYEKQDARMRLTKGRLLSMSIDLAIPRTISDIDNPHLALKDIKSVCKMSDSRALNVALSQLEDRKFTENDTVSSSMNKVILMQSETNELDSSYSDQKVIAKVVRSLPSSFSTFVSYWSMLAGTPPLPKTTKEP
jgi:hypothetical protein